MSRIKDYVCAGCGHYNINPQSNECVRCKTQPSKNGNSGHFYDVCIGDNQLTNTQGSSNHGKQQASSNQKKHKAKQAKAK